MSSITSFPYNPNEHLYDYVDDDLEQALKLPLSTSSPSQSQSTSDTTVFLSEKQEDGTLLPTHHRRGRSTHRRSRRKSRSSHSSADCLWECGICLETASDPCVSACGHLFCWSDLRRWLEKNISDPRCPICKSRCIPDKDVVPIYGRGRSSFPFESHRAAEAHRRHRSKSWSPPPPSSRSRSGTLRAREVDAQPTGPLAADASSQPSSTAPAVFIPERPIARTSYPESDPVPVHHHHYVPGNSTSYQTLPSSSNLVLTTRPGPAESILHFLGHLSSIAAFAMFLTLLMK